MKASALIPFLLLPIFAFSQSDIEKVMRGGEIILSGLTILKMARADDTKKDSKTIQSLCVKNKLLQKVTFRLVGKDAEDNEIKKELVVPKDGKECLFDVPKAIYTYEFLLATGEVYKKGEYKVEDEVTFTLKDP